MYPTLKCTSLLLLSVMSNNQLLLISRPVPLADDQESILERDPGRAAVVYQGEDGGKIIFKCLFTQMI